LAPCAPMPCARCLRSFSFVCLPSPPAADEPSFGSREAKLEGCALQRKAWDKNAEILAPLFTSLRGPLPAADLKRGEHGLSWAERLESVRLKHVFDSSKAEDEAKATMLKAARFGWA
jgi:hypothetical protein